MKLRVIEYLGYGNAFDALSLGTFACYGVRNVSNVLELIASILILHLEPHAEVQDQCCGSSSGG